MTTKPLFRRPVSAMLLWAAVGFARPYHALAQDACPVQPDWTSRFRAATASDPGAPTRFDGLPVLGPRIDDPNAWEVPCGLQTFAYRWCDPEGMAVTGEVVGSDLPAEFLCRTDGTATLTIPAVTPDWHVVHVRLTDEPPPYAQTAATRDVLIVFRGQYLQNRPPILYGGGT